MDNKYKDFEEVLASRYVPDAPSSLEERIIARSGQLRQNRVDHSGILSGAFFFLLRLVEGPFMRPVPALAAVLTVLVITSVFLSGEFIEISNSSPEYTAQELWGSLMLDNDFDPNEWL